MSEKIKVVAIFFACAIAIIVAIPIVASQFALSGESTSPHYLTRHYNEASETIIEESTPTNTTYVQQPTSAEQPARRLITASQAKELMQQHPYAIILDVRNMDEFYTGHIPGAILLPSTEIRALAPTTIPYKDTLILIYCRSGNRSQSAAATLISMGYTNVYDFGGINSWPYDITSNYSEIN